MAHWNLCCVLLLLAAMLTLHSLECKTGSDPGSFPMTRAADNNIYACGICGEPITVTLIATNYLLEPNFELNVTVGPQPQRELIYFLEKAAVKDPRWRFTAENYGTLGYMITKINKVEASVSDQTFWHIREHPSGNSLELGVSTYVPIDKANIVFNFTTWNSNTTV